MLDTIFMVFALVLFILSAVSSAIPGINTRGVNLVAAGLAFWVLMLLF